MCSHQWNQSGAILCVHFCAYILYGSEISLEASVWGSSVQDGKLASPFRWWRQSVHCHVLSAQQAFIAQLTVLLLETNSSNTFVGQCLVVVMLHLMLKFLNTCKVPRVVSAEALHWGFYQFRRSSWSMISEASLSVEACDWFVWTVGLFK